MNAPQDMKTIFLGPIPSKLYLSVVQAVYDSGLELKELVLSEAKRGVTNSFISVNGNRCCCAANSIGEWRGSYWEKLGTYSINQFDEFIQKCHEMFESKPLKVGDKVKFEWFINEVGHKFSGHVHSVSDYKCSLQNEVIFIIHLDKDSQQMCPFALVAVNSSELKRA